ncbi:MAG: hypothetical protein ACRC7C_09525 [Beijerinckiaceae bacterium]
MTSPTFFEEFKTRSTFVAAIALSNPVILTFYVVYSRSGQGALEFWSVGMVLISITCLLCLAGVALVLRSDRNKRFRAAQVRKRADKPDGKASVAGAEAAQRG